MALSGFLESGKVCFSDFGTHTFVMFRLIPGIFGHAKIMLRYFRTSNIISNVIGCNFMYRLFNIQSTYNQCHHFCLPAWVFTVHCLISIELPAVCSSCEDGCSILSLGRGLVILYDFSGHKPDLEGKIQICFSYGFSRPVPVYKHWDCKSARPDPHVSTQKASLTKPELSVHWESRFFSDLSSE